eukprot:COSAG06_NODE_431_length_15859_cov_19.762500_2_plen_85_part_00
MLYARPARTHSGGERDKPRMTYYRPLHRGVEATDGHMDTQMHRVHDGPGYAMDHVEEAALAGRAKLASKLPCAACAPIRAAFSQ